MGKIRAVVRVDIENRIVRATIGENNIVTEFRNEPGWWESVTNAKENVTLCGDQRLYDAFFARNAVAEVELTREYVHHNTPDLGSFRIPDGMFHLVTRGDVIYEGPIPTRVEVYNRSRSTRNEEVYLNELMDVLANGRKRDDRTGTGVVSKFGAHMAFDLRLGFPLLTTKRMFWKGIVEELLFFLRGETNTKILESKGVNIWRRNTSKEFQAKVGLAHLEEGDMGPLYGKQWRDFGGVDQVKEIIHGLCEDPTSRRLFVSAWNPPMLHKAVLPPCHVSWQVYCDPDTRSLDLHMYQRSADMFLGVPFNIASYSLLMHVLAKVTNLTPRRLFVSIGDAHIYRDHIEQVKEQLSRSPLHPPAVGVRKIRDIEDISAEDCCLMQYVAYPPIPAKMAA